MKLNEKTVLEIVYNFGEWKKTFRKGTPEKSIPASEIKNFDTEDPIYKKLLEQICKLDDDERFELLSLMWIGRGDGEAEDFDNLKRHAQSRNSSAIDDTHYLISKNDLDRFLQKGLQKLSK